MNSPHLTPQKLLGKNIFSKEWQAAKTAFVCFTPFPNGFKPYMEQRAQERYFLHSPNSEVCLCRYQNIPFLVISEVYGFPVGATTVEELVYYGIRHIIGVGYAGAFNDAPIGKPFVAVDTMSDLPIAAHYGVRDHEHCKPSGKLLKLVRTCIKEGLAEWGEYTVWTGNSLYREYPETVQHMREEGCDVVNMDVLSIYAVTPVSARDAGREVDCLYAGTVTDSKDSRAEEWKSDLVEAVKREGAHPHDNLVKFLVEKVLPRVL